MPAAAGIVLSGGRSSRMGRPKAALEWHGSTLLRRTAGVLARAGCDPVLVVRSPGQPLPALPAAVAVVDDAVEGRGPLQGLRTGLAAVRGSVVIAFVCAVDLPFLHPAFVTRVLAGLDGGWDAAVPDVHGRRQPLAAGYRNAVLPVVDGLLAAGERRLRRLLTACRVHRLDEAMLLADPALAVADPWLDSVRNVNSPGEYAEARAKPAPEVVVRCGAAQPVTVRAATLAGLLAAVGADLTPRVATEVSGGSVAPDGEFPLVAGDTLDLRSPID